MTHSSEYDSIRPYEGKEIAEAVERVRTSEEFLQVFSQISHVDSQVLASLLTGIETRYDFHQKVWGPIVDFILKKSSQGVTYSGLDTIDSNKSYTYISNHRDIILDCAILNYLLQSNGHKNCRTAVGDNLLVKQWVEDMMKLASSFIIERSVSVREMLKSSMLRSKYMRETIIEGEDSIWIAEREGRTKNGDDRCQPALLKMLDMSGTKDFAESFSQMNPVVVSISYEWEPCDALKIQENYLKKHATYQKTKDLDMLAMVTGMHQPKGRIHYAFSPITTQELQEIGKIENKGERINALAQLYDQKQHATFKLWPNNYVAYDMLNGTDKYAENYTAQDKEQFIGNMEYKLSKLEGDKQELTEMFLEMYANPVKNAE